MPKSERIIVPEKTKEKTCFVITPIGNETDPIRRHVDGIIDAAIIPVLEEFNFEPRIPHRLSMPGSINKQIIQEIHDCDLVIANLTDKNPNVMYELALRHCLGTPAIMIAEKGTELPFDINNQRTTFYVNDAQGVMALQIDLRKVIKEITDNSTYKSPIVSVLGDINMEKQLIEKEKENGDSSAVLGLILSRLDRIENDVRKTTQEDKPIILRNSSMHNMLSAYTIILNSNDGSDIETDEVMQEIMDFAPEKDLVFTKKEKGLRIIGHFKGSEDSLLFSRKMKNYCEKKGFSMEFVRGLL